MEFRPSNISSQDKDSLLKREAEQKAQDKRELVENAEKRLNLPPRFKDATFDNFDRGCQPVGFDAAKAFVEKDTTGFKGLYLYGNAGSGKTHLVSAIANKLLLKSFPRFVTAPELLLEIKKTFGNNHTNNDEYLDKLSYTKLLIIDDLGSEKPTEWVQETLFVLIDRRYTHLLPTIFTSNFSLDQLKDRLGYRIASRIAEMSDVVELKSVDYRIRKKL